MFYVVGALLLLLLVLAARRIMARRAEVVTVPRVVPPPKPATPQPDLWSRDPLERLDVAPPSMEPIMTLAPRGTPVEVEHFAAGGAFYVLQSRLSGKYLSVSVGRLATNMVLDELRDYDGRAFMLARLDHHEHSSRRAITFIIGGVRHFIVEARRFVRAAEIDTTMWKDQLLCVSFTTDSYGQRSAVLGFGTTIISSDGGGELMIAFDALVDGQIRNATEGDFWRLYVLR